MSTRRKQIEDIIGDFADEIVKYHKYSVSDILKADQSFERIQNAIHDLPSSYRTKLSLVSAQLDQWRGLAHSEYASFLFTNSTSISYSKIKKHIKIADKLFKSSRDKITAFEETVQSLDWVIIGQSHGGLLIDFGHFTIECIDFWILKYNSLQNYGSRVVSMLTDIDIDIYTNKCSNIKIGITDLRNALQILREFSAMIADFEHSQDQSNDILDLTTHTNDKLCKKRFRIPRTFFSQSMDLDSFKQWLLDSKCRTYFELSKAYVACEECKEAEQMYSEGIAQLLTRSNHGKYVETKPPHSWFQLIQSAIRFFIKNEKTDASNKAHAVIRNVLAFYQNDEWEIDSQYITGILLERGRLLMYSGEFQSAILTNEQIKTLHYKFETDEIKRANNNNIGINKILSKTNDLKDLVSFLKVDDSEQSNHDFYEWIKRINMEVMREVYYNKLWSIHNWEQWCPAPIDMCDDIIQFILSCLGIESKFHKMDLWKMLQFINEWNGNDNNDGINIDCETDDLKDSREKPRIGIYSNLGVLAGKMSKNDAEILIDFLSFGALSFLHNKKRERIRYRSFVEIMLKIVKLAKYTNCVQREAFLWLELGKCYKVYDISKAIECLTKAFECADSIENIQIGRMARLIQMQIFDIQSNHSSKEAMIEASVHKKYKINRALKYAQNHGDSCIISCKYDTEASMDVIIMSDASRNECEIESSDDERIFNKDPKRIKTHKKRVKKRSKFEESSSDEDEGNRSLNDSNTSDYSVRSHSNSRKRIALEPLNDSLNRRKRQKLDYGSDTQTEVTDLQCNNAPIQDLCSDSDEEEQEFDETIESQNSLESNDEIGHDVLNNYFHEIHDENIEGETKKITKINYRLARDSESITDIIKLCEAKILIADCYVEKAMHIKANEPKTIRTHKMIRHCYKKVSEFAHEVPSDCEKYIRKYIHRGNPEKINKNHSLLMLHYFASMDCLGKYFIYRKSWNEAINKYNDALQKIVNYKSVHQSIVLHWKYFCTSNIAYCYRERAVKSSESNKAKYKDGCQSKKYYRHSYDILSNLLQCLKSVKCEKYIREYTLSQSEINEQKAYSNIELGHTYNHLNQWRDAQKCYKKATEIANKNDLSHYECKAYFNIALILHKLKDFHSALYILQTKCRQCIQLCVAKNPINSTEFRIKQFEIERYIANILLQQKQMRSAEVSVQKMERIASNYLSKYKNYCREAEKYRRDYEEKKKYKSQIDVFESKGGNPEIYKALKRHFALKSYGTIIENKQKYFRLMEQTQNISHSLHISFMIGCAFKERNEFAYAQQWFQTVLIKYKSSNNNNVSAQQKWLPQIAQSCFEVMEWTNANPKQRMDILLLGAQYINHKNNRNIIKCVQYYQLTILYFETYLPNDNNYYYKVQNIRNKLKILHAKVTNSNRRVPKPQMISSLHRQFRYRYNQNRKTSYRHRNNSNNIFANPSDKNKNKNRNQNSSAFVCVSSRNQQKRQRAFFQQTNNSRRKSANARCEHRTQIAKNLAGLNEGSSVRELTKAIAEIERVLQKHPTMSVMSELNNIKELYQNYKSTAEQNERQKKHNRQQMHERNIHKIIPNDIERANIKNNSIGIIHEQFQWIRERNMNCNQWSPFGANESQEIEQSYRNKETKYVNYGRYEIRFNVLGAYKLYNNQCRVQRRVLLQSLHERKMIGWASKWMRDTQNSNKKRYKLDKNRVSDKMEYFAICELVKNRGMSAGLEIHRIERVQNITNQQRYNNCALGNGTQLLLFHGTRPLCVNGIIDEGTDFRLHGDNGTKYGNGSYFGVYSSYAAQFANVAEIDASIGKMVKYMFLFAVRVGQYCVGANGMRRPPKIANNREGKAYDSVVDNVSDPSIFVTFDNAQSLPLYLITFTFDETQ